MRNYSPTWKHMLLSDVFKFFNREELEILEITSRSVLAIVKQDYPVKPFRVFSGLNIYIGTKINLTVILWNKFARLFQDFSNIAQFKAKQHDYANSGKCLDFPIDEVRPFLGQTIRFEVTNIFLHHSRTNSQHIADIESVSHLWSGQYVCINGDYCQFQMPIVPTLIHDCDLIFRSSVIINSCRKLRIQNINIVFKSYPNLYNLEIVEFSLLEDFDISPVNFVGFVEEIGHHKSNTTVLFHTVSESQEKQFVEQIRQTFLTTREPLKFKAILVTHSSPNVAGFNGESKLKLPVEYVNGYTNGTLQMRSIKGQEREDFCKTLRKSRVDTQYLNLLCLECQ
ncbi:hypothetical protein DdX_09514 [Ditylenchus destructor]|uniref:Uncharacterized protein n=1 Tax=Ditylenchus destructor TaxID=166010 RepID=A0AAD4N2E9_9BILA|nr:hypothetical protein DdX_09514 [Ditylenchus destructor]